MDERRLPIVAGGWWRILFLLLLRLTAIDILGPIPSVGREVLPDVVRIDGVSVVPAVRLKSFLGEFGERNLGVVGNPVLPGLLINCRVGRFEFDSGRVAEEDDGSVLVMLVAGIAETLQRNPASHLEVLAQEHEQPFHSINRIIISRHRPITRDHARKDG